MGDITVFPPGNKACAEYSAVYGPLSKAVCEYHVVKGVVSADGLSGADLTTVEGSKITYRRMFRKHFIDNAFCAATASPPRTSYKGDIKASNGVIHMLNEVIYPGWSESAGMEGDKSACDETRDTCRGAARAAVVSTSDRVACHSHLRGLYARDSTSAGVIVQ